MLAGNQHLKGGYNNDTCRINASVVTVQTANTLKAQIIHLWCLTHSVVRTSSLYDRCTPSKPNSNLRQSPIWAARSSQTGEWKQVCTPAAESIHKEIAALRKTMMNETDLEVIEHVCSDGGAFKLGCACKCFPLIGSQKRFITRGEYRSATQATEKKFNSDLMSCRLEISVYAHRLSGEPLLFVLRRREFFLFLNSGD